MPLALSIVSPVYQAEPIVDELVRQVGAAAAAVTSDYEIVLVDDGSSDGSWQRIAAIAARDPRLKGLLLSRNFGQARAIRAGLDQAEGELVVVMDCDLQDDPAYIPALVAKAREGYDIVLTRRRRRQTWIRRFLSAGFFHLFNLVADRPTEDRGVGGYSLISRRTVEAIRQMPDVNANYLATVGWIGGRRALVAVEARPRFAGKSSYTMTGLFGVAIAVLCGSSSRLLAAAFALGLGYLAAAVAGLAYLATRQAGWLAGRAPLAILVVGSTGLILVSLGVVGLYLGSVFNQVRGRPAYLVQARLNYGPGSQNAR